MLKEVTAIKRTKVNGIQFVHAYSGSNVEMRGSDGSFSQWNFDHYFKVKAARQAQSEVRQVGNRKVSHHPLIGKLLEDTVSGKQYLVESVFLDWWRGGFLMALLNHKGSHRNCVIEIVSCVDPSILKQAEEFQSEFRLVQEITEAT